MRTIQLASILVLTAALPACTAYRTLPQGPVALQAAPRPIKEARFTLRSGERIEVEFPRVEGDSVQGFVFGGAVQRLAVADVIRVEVHKVSVGKTAGLVLGMAVAGSAAAGAVRAGEFSSGRSEPRPSASAGAR